MPYMEPLLCTRCVNKHSSCPGWNALTTKPARKENDVKSSANLFYINVHQAFAGRFLSALMLKSQCWFEFFQLILHQQGKTSFSFFTCRANTRRDQCSTFISSGNGVCSCLNVRKIQCICHQMVFSYHLCSYKHNGKIVEFAALSSASQA